MKTPPVVLALLLGTLLQPVAGLGAAPASPGSPSTWPQPYTVERDDAAGVLTLRTRYYTVQHDLRRGGVIARIALTHGRATNLLVRPLEAQVRDERDRDLSDLRDAAPKVAHRRDGSHELVTVDAAFVDREGRASALRVRTTFDYRWGYVRIHREFGVPAVGVRVRAVCPVVAVLAPSLTAYGYREGTAEEEGAPPFSFGSNRWGKLRPGQPAEAPVLTPYVPRSMIFVDPGVEGLEWFVGSDLWPWEGQLAGRRGQGRCALQWSENPAGVALTLAPFWTTNTPLVLTNEVAFDYYLAVPLLEGHAQRPWVHTSFNRNRGEWVGTETIQRWAEQGYQTVHCHNDGDYYGDGLFWRDGAYPPYPDMDRYDQVLQACRRVGIRTATYFSNKELHSSTAAFREHGPAWGRQDRAGKLQHNFFRAGSEFGVQMCLRSGWLEFLKGSIDRVLRNHPLDGVYYDWNVALFCRNPQHVAGPAAGGRSRDPGHWDMDELLELMEWTRDRVGPRGLVIVHNTTTPMFATENFADAVVATEWGYGKWTERAPELADLPLEWSLAGARARGVISYGSIDSQAPRRLHRLFALEAFLGGVTPWPASPETLALLPWFQPLDPIETFRFADWRNPAVRLSDPHCAAAVYSRPGEAYLLLANLNADARDVTCALDAAKLPHPLERPVTATRLALPRPAAAPAEADADADADPAAPVPLEVARLLGEGVSIALPGADAVMIRVR